jgi:hypothetical protein
MVLDVAPESDLYLAAVDNSIGYRNALDWAVDKDVDVVTMSLGFLNQPNDGTGPLSQKANEAVGQGGFVFTTSTGNQADRHWQGEFADPDNDDVLEFADGNEVNYLNSDDGQVSQISAGTPFSTVLNWDDWSVASSNYNLYLVYASSIGADLQYVDKVDTDARGASPTKRSVVTAPSDGYYGIMIEQTHGTGEEVELFTDKNLEYRTPESSIVSPAVAEDTVGVGAVRYDTLDLEKYSSRGPTNSGAQGVTFLAPTCATSAAYNGPYCGTSGAAPHAGGAAALLTSEYSLNRTETENALKDTSDTFPFPTEVGGSGILNLTRASTLLEGADRTAPDPSVDSPGTVARNTTFDIAVTVEDDGGVTVIEFTPNSLNLTLSADSGQAPAVTVNDDQPKENVTFGTGYSDTYTTQANVTGGQADKLSITAWIGDTDQEKSTATANSTVTLTDGSLSPDNPFADANGQPVRELEAVSVLLSWNENGDVDGVNYGELDIVGYLVNWNEAR